MGAQDITVIVLQKKTLGALEDADRSACKTRCMLTRNNSSSSCLHPDHTNAFIPNKKVEKPHCITAPSDTGYEIVRQFSFSLENLLPCLFTYHRLEVSDNQRKGMRAEDGAQDIMRSRRVSCPIPHSLVDSIFEGP